METRNCQNCKKDFTIEPDDFSFYEKTKVPAPTWCPECRLIRRIACINGFSLFYRNCDKCGKRTLSMYPPSQKITVYCQPCWWADDWDGTEHGMDYDPSKHFFEQVKELQDKTPHVALETTYLTLKDCEYCNAIAYSKNCILAGWADYCENVCYSAFLNGIKDSTDCLRMQDSELCYESIGQNKSYRVFYSQECDACTDVWFSRNCYSSTNCVGCVNLRGASYRIFNEQYTKENYFKKLAEYRLDTRDGIETLKKEAEKFWKEHPYRAYSGNTLNVDVTGEYVYESKNAHDTYLSMAVEDSRYVQFATVPSTKGCYDYSGWGNNVTSLYEVANIGDNGSNSKCSYYCFPDILDTEYSMWCVSSKQNFGCVNLKRKQYAILNKVYDKETYEKLKAEIIEGMKARPFVDPQGQTYTYGDFFPPLFSQFAYNTSNAAKFFPKTKEEVVAAGYSYYDDEEQQIQETLLGADIPQSLPETPDSIVNEVIACTTCPKRYKILPLEFDLLRKMNLPLPVRCPRCRDKTRFEKINLPRLYDRTCNQCNKEVKTAFAPDRPEIIFCEKCYQQEMV